MKKLYCILPFLLVACGAKKGGDVTTSQAYEVSQTEVTKTLEFLASDALEGRATGSVGIDKAATYLETVFKDYGIQPYFSTYKDTLTNLNQKAYNVVGYLPGTDAKLKEEFVIFSAHYDHIGRVKEAVDGDDIANGANDNAAGSTLLTEVAKYYGKNKNNKRSILFVFFSGEELGLKGSYHLADKLESKQLKLYTMLNFEMLGVPMNRPFQVYLTGANRSNMGDVINKYAGENTVGKLAIEMQYRLFMQSDNYPFFLKYNIPAHSVSSFDFENFKFYHHVKDEAKLMNTEFMTKTVVRLLPALDQMVSNPVKEIKLN